MQVEAYCDEGKFIPLQPIKIPNGRRAIVTIIDFPISEVQPASDTEAIPNESRAEWLERLHEALDLSMDEELPDWPFERSKEMRPPINFAELEEDAV